MTDKQHDLDLEGSETYIEGNVNGPVISGKVNGSITIISVTAPSRIPHEIPQAPQDFTGREDELDDLLTYFDRGATITGLRGMGGVGKTVLAYKLAEMLRDRYPDGQLMVNLNGTGEMPLKPFEAMEKVIHSYNIEAILPDDEIAVGKMYRSLLDGKRALILLDNAADDKQVGQLMPPKTCGVIVTSRNIFTFSGLKRIDLDTLKPKKAVELLLKVYGYDLASPIFLQQEGTWNEIARLCGYLPLALRAAGSMLANTIDMTPYQYLKELKVEHTRLEKIGKEGIDLDLVSSFNLSYARLPPENARVFRTLSIFPYDFDAEAEIVICQDEGHKRLSDLLKWSLVEYQKSIERYRLHDLMRIFAAKKQNLEDKTVNIFRTRQRYAFYYENILSRANDLFLESGINGIEFFDKERGNIQAGQAWADANLEKDDLALELCRTYPNSGCYVFDLRIHPEMKISWLKSSLDACRKLGDRQGEGANLGNLGRVYMNLGETQKAIEYHEQSLMILREIGNRQGEEAVLGNLGIAYKNLGETQKAIEYYKQQLVIAREIGDQRGEGIGLANLGQVYAALGEPDKAIEHLQQALEIALLIGDKQIEGASRGNLGKVYAALGELGKAIEHLQQALEIALLIKDKLNEGAWLGNLGQVYAALGEPVKAIEHFLRALEIARQIKDKLNEGAWLGNLGQVYAALGEPVKAIEQFQQALEIARQTKDKRNEGAALYSLGLAFDVLGQRDKAIKFTETVLSIFEQIESPNAEIAQKKLAEWQSQN